MRIFSSVVLPTPFGPTSAMRSPRCTRSEKSRTISRPPKDLATSSTSTTSLPEREALSNSILRRAGAGDLRAALGAHLRQPPHPALVALAPRRDALDRPAALGLDQPVELVAGEVLVLEDLVAPFLERGEALVEPAHVAAVDPQDAVGQRAQERPVVADDHDRRARLGEVLFQPGDGGDVEMVGRLVEQHQVGRLGEDPRQRRAAPLAARRRRGSRLGVELDALHRDLGAPVLGGIDRGFDEGAEGRDSR